MLKGNTLYHRTNIFALPIIVPPEKGCGYTYRETYAPASLYDAVASVQVRASRLGANAFGDCLDAPDDHFILGKGNLHDNGAGPLCGKRARFGATLSTPRASVFIRSLLLPPVPPTPSPVKLVEQSVQIETRI